MASAASSGESLSRLSKAELIERLEALRRESRGPKVGQGPPRDGEHAYAKSDARFRAIADDLPVIIWVFNLEDRPVFLNRAYLEFLGVSLEEGLAGDYHESIHPDDQERMRLVEQEWARSHGPYRIEYRERRADGVWRWFLDVAVPRFAADGRFLGSIGSSVDITEQKEAESALRDRDIRLQELRQHLEQVSRLSAMGQLSETASRELSEPLTALMNYGAAARRMAKTAGGFEADRIVEMIDKALNQAKQAGELLRHLRDAYERSDRKTTPQEVNEIVEEALGLALIDPTRAGIRCELELAEGLPSVVGNRVQLQQVVYNLIRNALEAMAGADRRDLTIKTTCDENGAVRVTVGDTGCGLSPEVAKRFFGPTVVTGYEGLGRGLSISHGIVESHGGRLWAEPNPGGGTRFHFTLPSEADPGG
jgi:PAS domain S-box-containing protein